MPAQTYSLPFKPRSIAMQGLHGSNSHNAIRELFGNEANAVPCDTLDDAFDFLKEHIVELAVIPAENTNAQKVPYVMHLLRKTGVKIVGETIRQIDHCLVGLPGTDLSKVRYVLSHKHALEQCSIWLAENPHILGINFFDTAGAAIEVAKRGDPTVIAIAPREAAEIYGLEVLNDKPKHWSIQNTDANHTRFLVLAREMHNYEEEPRPFRTSLLINLKNGGAAPFSVSAKLTNRFEEEGCPVVFSESYFGPHFTIPTFLYEVRGHQSHTGIQRVIGFALSKGLAIGHNVIGCYPTHPSRRYG